MTGSAGQASPSPPRRPRCSFAAHCGGGGPQPISTPTQSVKSLPVFAPSQTYPPPAGGSPARLPQAHPHRQQWRPIGTEWSEDQICSWQAQVVPPPEQQPPPDPRSLPPEPLSPKEIYTWREEVAKAKNVSSPPGGAHRDVLDYVRWQSEQVHADPSTLPSDAMRLRWLGNARFMHNGFAAATASYGAGARVARCEATDAHLEHVFYANRAAAHLPLQNFALALSDAQKALDIRRSHVPAHLRRALALIGMGRLEDAAEAVFECARICKSHLTESQWNYLAFLLHKALPLCDDAARMAARLGDHRLGLVPNFLIACLFHTLHLLAADITDCADWDGSAPALGAASDPDSDPSELPPEANGGRLDAGLLLRYGGGGCPPPPEATSMGPRSWTRSTDGGGHAARLRLLAFARGGGREAAGRWREEGPPKAVRLAQQITRLLNQYLPPDAERALVRRVTALEREGSCGRSPSPSSSSEAHWQPGDRAEGERGGRWSPVVVCRVPGCGEIEVQWGDGERTVLSNGQLRRPPPVGNAAESPRASPRSLSSAPSPSAVDRAVADALSSGQWVEREDRSGRVFYYHQASKTTTRDLRREVERGLARAGRRRGSGGHTPPAATGEAVEEEPAAREEPPAEGRSAAAQPSPSTVRRHAQPAEDEAADEYDALVEEAILKGEWLPQRSARTGRLYYYHPKTKSACTDLRAELARRLTAAESGGSPRSASTPASPASAAGGALGAAPRGRSPFRPPPHPGPRAPPPRQHRGPPSPARGGADTDSYCTADALTQPDEEPSAGLLSLPEPLTAPDAGFPPPPRDPHTPTAAPAPGGPARSGSLTHPPPAAASAPPAHHDTSPAPPTPHSSRGSAVAPHRELSPAPPTPPSNRGSADDPAAQPADAPPGWASSSESSTSTAGGPTPEPRGGPQPAAQPAEEEAEEEAQAPELQEEACSVWLDGGTELRVQTAKAPDGKRAWGRVAVHEPEGGVWHVVRLAYDPEIASLRLFPVPAVQDPPMRWVAPRRLDPRRLRRSLAALAAVARAAEVRHELALPEGEDSASDSPATGPVAGLLPPCTPPVEALLECASSSAATPVHGPPPFAVPHPGTPMPGLRSRVASAGPTEPPPAPLDTAGEHRPLAVAMSQLDRRPHSRRTSASHSGGEGDVGLLAATAAEVSLPPSGRSSRRPSGAAV